MSHAEPTRRITLRDGDEASSRAPSFAEARSLKRELLEELRAGGAEGVRPEDLLPRWPGDPQADADVASLLFADYCRRLEKGESASASDYERRFPEHKDSLAGLLRQHSLMRSLGAASGSGLGLRLPDVGEELFGFRLRYELGRGAFARVFLAEQEALAGRPVVLKISAIVGSEPQTLAQLQHTNIVPIYSVHENPAAGLRAVCMPYFGGASLSRVLEEAWQGGRQPVQGAELLRGLRAVQAPAWGRAAQVQMQIADCRLQIDRDEESAICNLQSAICNSSYVRTVAWLVAELADGLQHAHERGVLHHDVKPSNVLLSAEGRPMLLDFNLAQDLHNQAAAATVGGTVSYMAPEHLRALAARDPALCRHVDHRSDVYSLGMVLYEALTGHSPFDQSGSYAPLPMMVEAMALERGRTTPSPRRHRPDTPWALESIARKCLTPDPAGRYQQAAHLAEDLRRFLDDRPLKYAPELSTAERLRKWVRRHPRFTPLALAAVAVLLLGGAAAGLVGASRHLAASREELATTQARDRRRAYEDGTVRALCLVNTTAQAPEHARQGLAACEDENARKGLTVCEETLGLYGVLERDDWQRHPDWQRLAQEDRRRLAEDTRELLLSLAWAKVRTAADPAGAARQALALLDRAEAIDGLEPSPALLWDRASYLDKLGDADAARRAREAAARLEPHTARDHHQLAVAYLRDGKPDDDERALAELRQAVRLEPRHYWSWMHKGLCEEGLGQNDLAAADFGVCTGLWPEFAWGHFNRGHALAACGRLEESVAAYSAALDRDPGFVLASLNRGLSLQVLGRSAKALADFDRVLAAAPDDGSRLGAEFGRGLALEALGRHDEADGAFAAALAPGREAPEEQRRSMWLKYGFAVSRRLPGQARKAFDEVLRRRPNDAEALYGQAMLRMAQKDLEEALGYFNRAMQASPGWAKARRDRAIVLARLGRFAAAEADVNWCLDQEKDCGEAVYAAACVSALLARRWAAEGRTAAEVRAAANQAVYYLEQAFSRGIARAQAADDPDLEGVRSHPQFRRLLADKGESAK
jgi:serine/threonine protein kinase/Tfp pilus assembly protein PilF